MIALSDEPKIIAMAHTLGIHAGDRVLAIRDFCLTQVRALIKGAGRITSIEELMQIVCEKLRLTIIEVWTEDDLTAVIEKYARQERDAAFAFLRRDLTDDTFATLLQRKRVAGEKGFSYVAIIDCRSPAKAARRYFSRWHEIAHVLTTVEQLQFALHRSTTKKDPIETMMDKIAGDVGFFDPIFMPFLDQECQKQGGLTFAGVENIRRAFSTHVSLEAMLNACVTRIPAPIILLQAGMAYKKDEERALASTQYELLPAEKPVAKLRVVSVIANDSARDRHLTLPKNMRVPPASAIAEVMKKDEGHSIVADENLNWWRSSTGAALRHASVRVEALRIRDRVFAILRA